MSPTEISPRGRGQQVFSCVGSASDTEIMDHAGASGVVLFTHDVDFGMLLAMRRSGGRSVVRTARRMCFLRLSALLS